MTVIKFSMSDADDSKLLEEIATLEWFDFDNRDMAIRFVGAYPQAKNGYLQAVHRHIGGRAQSLSVETDGHIYHMIIDPRPERGSHNPPSLLVRYKIQAHTID